MSLYPTNANINTIKAATDTLIAGSLGNATAEKLDGHLLDVYSKELLYLAAPLLKLYQFAKIKEELMSQPGLTIKMITFKNLVIPKALKEEEELKTQALHSQFKEISIFEHGDGVQVTSYALQGSITDLVKVSLESLARNLGYKIETELRDVACKGGNNTSLIYAHKKGDAKVTSRADLAVNKNELTMATLYDGLEILATANVPKINGDFYACIVHPHCVRWLRDDPDWVDIAKYAAPERFFVGELGRINDIRFFDTSIMPNGAAPADDYGHDATLVGAGAAGADVYKSILFGQDYYGFAIAKFPSIQIKGDIDFGRKMAIVWTGTWGSGILNDNHGVIIESV